MKSKKITISGLAGTGKSTVGKLLADKINYSYFSIGDFSREIAKSKGLTINEFQIQCKKDKSLDRLIDKAFLKKCNFSKNIVIDYRLGFHFVKEAINILLTVSDEIAVDRIQNAKRKNESINAISIQKRNNDMKNRFIKTYNIDFTDKNNYHLVIDTDNKSPNEVIILIINKLTIFKK